MKLKMQSMRNVTNLSKIALVAFAALVISSCSKKEDELTNLSVERNNTSNAQTLDMTNINTNMVIEDRVNGVDYIVTHNIVITGNVTINPGVTIQFAEGAGFLVEEQGSIIAKGAVSNEIYFNAQNGKRGGWLGITFLSNSPRNVLSYCKIEQGGADNTYGKANVTVGSGNNTAQVEISNCKIVSSAADGILLSEGSKVLNFSSNNFTTNTAYPISMHIADAVNMNDGNLFSNNGKEFIHVTATNMVNAAVTLKNLHEAFCLSGEITAGNTVTIEAGARIYMDQNASMIIDGQHGHGSFKAVGTASQPIIISSAYNGTGIWKNIQFISSNSDDNHIEYCTISGGGLTSGSGAEGMISVVNNGTGESNVVIRNSNIMNSAAIGIFIESQNSEYNSDIIYANNYSNNVKGNISIQ